MHFINDILWAEKPQSVTCTLDMLSHMKPSVTVTIETKTAMKIAGWGREGRTPFPYFSPFSFSPKWTARVSEWARCTYFFSWSRSSFSLSLSLSDAHILILISPIKKKELTCLVPQSFSLLSWRRRERKDIRRMGLLVDIHPSLCSRATKEEKDPFCIWERRHPLEWLEIPCFHIGDRLLKKAVSF